jgi:hypothetical protein
MSRSKYWQTPFWFIFFMTMALLGSSSGAAESEPLEPPFTLPFDTKKTGEAYTFHVKVIDPLVYAVGLRFYITRPSKYSHFFDRESVEEEKRLHAILGGAVSADSGNWTEPGVPAKFLVQIHALADKKLFLSEVVDHPKIAAMYMGKHTNLVQTKLSPGVYAVRVEYLQGDPKLWPLQADISFARAHHGK